jgi:hypothetical protein
MEQMSWLLVISQNKDFLPKVLTQVGYMLTSFHILEQKHSKIL